ncbi:MAG: hypothetical protein D6760_07700 [Deltaproteobacteria bacterium]|nr:MAG: hypothetical protein D6760_07700 [Deltaproteobacteria bacterium]
MASATLRGYACTARTQAASNCDSFSSKRRFTDIPSFRPSNGHVPVAVVGSAKAIVAYSSRDSYIVVEPREHVALAVKDTPGGTIVRSSIQLAAAGICLVSLLVAPASGAYSADFRTESPVYYGTNRATGGSGPVVLVLSGDNTGATQPNTPPKAASAQADHGRAAPGNTTASSAAAVNPARPAETDSAAPAGIAPANAEPVEVVERLHTTLLDVMQHASTLGYQGRYQRLEPVLRRTLDLDFMGSKAAGRHWREFSAEEQSRWLDAFSRMTLANYAGRFNGYSGQHFETLGSEPAPHDTILVRTRLTGGEEDVQLNYRLRKTPSGWRVIDIYMHGTVSELALRRAEYSTAIERDGLDKVVADVEAKIHDLETGKSS